MIRRYASAGAVVVTTDVTDPRTLLLDQTRVTGERQTVAPKGRIEPGESPLAAAVREVAEEAGLTALGYAGYLGQEAYQFTDNDGAQAAKTVDWFLLTTATTDADARAAEGFTGARWFDPDDAVRVASHPGFVTHLRRTANLIRWRQGGTLPFSATVNAVVTQVAEATQPLLHTYGAGVAVCGSAARGDFIDGWSDIDFIGYGLPATSPAAESLAALVRDIADQHAVRASLHLADQTNRSPGTAGPLYDMKLRATLRRIGTDVALIAGTAPETTPGAPKHIEVNSGLAALLDFATRRLSAPATDSSSRKDRARRALSVTCSAARTLAVTIDPHTDLRLQPTADLLERHHPDAPVVPLLRAYDSFRQHGARDLNHAEQLAERGPDAIRDLIERHRLLTPAGG
ncbi:NUDIX domain-containing protein [Rhizomonospora bruguierae]|uniref:NUDIX domain-containing protein n=1 Tax=Rhizomonospora bruguierae TaxID=1581705 RepID=UPI001BD092EA|nr:NUDIX domain-containing protein [Micromonospora sp. NBRC 107566]